MGSMPRPPSDTTQVTVRVANDWIARADRLAEQLARPGLPVTRTDAFRAAIAYGLDALEAEQKKTKKK